MFHVYSSFGQNELPYNFRGNFPQPRSSESPCTDSGTARSVEFSPEDRIFSYHSMARKTERSDIVRGEELKLLEISLTQKSTRLGQAEEGVGSGGDGGDGGVRGGSGGRGGG